MVRCHTFGADMGFEVETKDCTAVTDAELGELESLSVDSPNARIVEETIGDLSSAKRQHC